MIFLVGGWSLAAGVVVTGQDNSTFVSPDNAPPLLYRVAQFQYRAGEPAEAIATLRRIETNSSVVPVRHRLAQIPIQTLLGQCHESLGDLDAALVAYERALGVAGQTPICWHSSHGMRWKRERVRCRRWPPSPFADRGSSMQLARPEFSCLVFG
ncbi:MAG: tetratricopeptide repeat protein [Planctomycetota bacterium]